MLLLFSVGPHGDGNRRWATGSGQKKHLPGTVASKVFPPSSGIILRHPGVIARLTAAVVTKGMRVLTRGVNHHAKGCNSFENVGFQARVRSIRTEKCRFPCMLLRFPRKKGEPKPPLEVDACLAAGCAA